MPSNGVRLPVTIRQIPERLHDMPVAPELTRDLVYWPYSVADKASCLKLFNGNVPAYFAQSEGSEFEQFLDDCPGTWSYDVIVRSDFIVACGGYALDAHGTTASLCWGMVDNALHGTGLGRLLTMARLDAVRAMAGVRQVRIDTSQHTEGFYASLGFELNAIMINGYGPGLDRWDMTLRV